jgi:glycosyltransferase involved in cell wall biosynthesis
MKISVVTISFNQAPYLASAIDSVLAQRGVEREYIVVDPGSTDGSRELVASYGAAIDRTIFEPDAGPADGLNQGFAAATGDVLCFLNSDDTFLPDAFLRIARAFERRPQADFISGCGYFIDAAGRRMGRVVPTRLRITYYVYGACTIFQQGTFFKRHCLQRVGGLNGENRTCWDAELFLDFARAGLRHEVIYDELACFRLHESSITVSGRLREAQQRDARRMFAKARGRPWRAQDDWIGMGMRATKLLRNPRYALERILGR